MVTGYAGVGSGIYPEEGVFMRVGGDIRGDKSTSPGATNGPFGGDIQYGGNCLSSPNNSQSCGTLNVKSDASLTKVALDKGPWIDYLEDFKVRSEYWYKLKPNGKYVTRAGGPDQNTMVLYAGDDDCLQVFLLDRFALEEAYNIAFDQSLLGKTILINVSPFNNYSPPMTSYAKWTGKFVDPWSKTTDTRRQPCRGYSSNRYSCSSRIRLGGTRSVSICSSFGTCASRGKHCRGEENPRSR